MVLYFLGRFLITDIISLHVVGLIRFSFFWSQAPPHIRHLTGCWPHRGGGWGREGGVIGTESEGRWLSLEPGPLPTTSLRWVSQHQAHRDFHGAQLLGETDFFMTVALAGTRADVFDTNSDGVCRDWILCLFWWDLEISLS